MILDKEKIYKYIHINYKLSALNIKYYNFDSIFDTTKFGSGNVHINVKVIHSTI
jgi:hypothetical protein